MGFMWTDVITSTSTGTSTAKTTLNGGTAYTTSNLAGNLYEVAPYQAATAAYTAAQTSLQLLTVESTSIGALSPKVIGITPTHGGLGTFAGVQVPIIKSYRFNTSLPNSNIPLTFSGTPMIANTAAFRVGATATFTTDQPAEKEVFWDHVSTTTSSGTAAASVSLPSITVNGASALGMTYANFSVGTVTASESYVGYLSVSSNDLTPVQTIRSAIQPVGAGLGTAVEVLQEDQRLYAQFMGIRPTATLTATYTQEEALTSAATVVWGVGYIR